jgi:hypothetical protein
MASVASMVADFPVVRSAAGRLIGWGWTGPESKLWIIPLILLVFLFGALMPLFYLALFRNADAIHVPRRLRRIALAGILGLSLYVATTIPGVIGSIHAQDGSTQLLRGGLLEISNLSAILLLVALSREAGDGAGTGQRMSKWFRWVTVAGVITLFAWLAIGCLRVAISPLLYIQLRDAASANGRTLPSYGAFLSEIVRQALPSAPFVSTHILYKSRYKSRARTLPVAG